MSKQKKVSPTPTIYVKGSFPLLKSGHPINYTYWAPQWLTNLPKGETSTVSKGFTYSLNFVPGIALGARNILQTRQI